MEALTNALEPYQDLVKEIAAILTLTQLFTGILVCRKIYKNQSTEDKNANGFLGGLVVGILMLKFGFMTDDLFGIKLNGTQVIFNSAYLVCFYKYCANKYDEVQKKTLIAAVFVAVVIIYSLLENPDKVDFRYSVITTTLMVILVAPTFVKIADVMGKKDASDISFPNTLMGALTAFTWLLFGVITANIFCIVPNLVGLGVNLVQLGLITVYPKPKTD